MVSDTPSRHSRRPEVLSVWFATDLPIHGIMSCTWQVLGLKKTKKLVLSLNVFFKTFKGAVSGL